MRLALACFLAWVAPAYSLTVEQAHLSFTAVESSMGVDFVSDHQTLVVDYQGADSSLQTVQTTSQEHVNIGWLHRAEMTNLKPDTSNSIQYRVRDEADGSMTSWTSFEALPYTRSPGPIAAVLADFGLVNDVSMNHITNDAKNNDIDFVLHAGDFAYNLDSNNSETGNRFMRAISEATASVPYMGCPGNHERYENFTQFTRRFQGLADFVGTHSGSGNSFYYSFDVDQVHYISVNTELYAYPDETAASDFPVTAADQLAWLRADLEKANNNRDAVPWIVMMGHKGWYMDDLAAFPILTGEMTTNFTGFDDLACEFGIDLYLTGHVHLYQRFLPTLGPDNIHFLAKPRDVDHDCVSEDGHTYTNPRQMVTLVVGSPGDQEINPRPLCTALDAINRLRWDDAQHLCTAEYGYGHLQAVNSTHLYWEFMQTGRSPGVKEWHNSEWAKPFDKPIKRDYLWIVQEDHGSHGHC